MITLKHKGYDIVLVCTNYFTLRAFLMPMVGFIEKDYSICVVANITADEQKQIIDEFAYTIDFHIINIQRKPNIVLDLLSLVYLIKLIFKAKPKIVLSIMSKSGLLSMLASYICRVPNRVHFFTGQHWCTKTGITRYLYKRIDKLIVFLCTKILVDGRGQKNFLVSENVAPSNEIDLIWNGSINGVEFDKITFNQNDKLRIRDEIGVRPHERLILFMSRMTVEKGFNEVLLSYKALRSISSHYKLLLIGPDEECLVEKKKYNDYAGIHYISYTKEAAKYIYACDAFVSPSYKEGLPTTLLQALSLNAKVFVSDVYGNNDLIEHEVNGYLHPVRDWTTLYQQIHCAMEGNIKCLVPGYDKRIRRDYDRRVFQQHFRNYIRSLNG